ncbi:AI-2E family transporter [Microbacterium sp. 4R-513]|uniref:AI-2E family transporter n=1 Tax=Microbacterium sp. 4R-513 TaxID=2567934 RepID=UPI0013E14B7D|nr:AI-2E family transporter [Microbacterium sp. 4R-513]QIG38913.1 AI-2E family transporter [Microbacterium sp. 4R-513]
MTEAIEGARPLSADPAAGTDAAPAAGTDAADASVNELIPAVIVDRPQREVWTNVGHPFATGLVLTIGALAAIALGVAFVNLSTIVIYIVMALFVALALDPVVKRLERRNVSRPWGIVIVYGTFGILLVLVLWFLIPALFSQGQELIKNIPSLVAEFQKSDFYKWLQDTFGSQAGTMLKQVQAFFTNPSNLAAIGGGIVKVGVNIGLAISGLLIILVLSLYFLAGLPAMKVAFAQLTPAHSRPTVTSLTNQITDSIGGYLTGMVILAFFNSVVGLILHLVLGLPFPFLMAVAAFCITLIPLIGSVCYWVFATVVALFSDPVAALIFAIVYLIYIQVEAYVLTPRVMNKTVSVPGALVVIGALVGGTLLGLLGALVAIPVTASILLIIKQIFIPRQDRKVKT